MSTPNYYTREYAPEDIQWVDGFAAPPAPGYRPFAALSAAFKLLVNKEDTRQVFEVFSALAGRDGLDLFARFVATPYGRRVVTEPVRLEHILGNRETLRRYPEGSVARVYLDFMEEDDLTPDGLIDAAEEAGLDFSGETQFEEYRRMMLHLDVSHDLWHVLTGYGRDSLGELCNLIYTYRNTGNIGIYLIVGIGLMAQKIERPGQPIWKSLREARRISDNSNWIMEHDVEALLSLPLGEARRVLNIATPVTYNAIPADIKANLLKPRIIKTQTEREERQSRAQTA